MKFPWLEWLQMTFETQKIRPSKILKNTLFKFPIIWKKLTIRIMSAETHLWELILTATSVYERFSNIRSTNFPGWHFSLKISGHNSRNSGIWKAERYSISMDCQMNFRMFPFDHQLCPLMLESYSYSNDQVVFQWDENYATPIEYSDKIEVNDLEQGPKFTRPNCVVEYSTGNYSCLRLGQKLKTCFKWEFFIKKPSKVDILYWNVELDIIWFGHFFHRECAF